MDVEASIHVEMNLTPKEYNDVIDSIDRVYAAYLHHFPHNLEAVSPLIALKSAVVLGMQDVKNV